VTAAATRRRLEPKILRRGLVLVLTVVAASALSAVGLLAGALITTRLSRSRAASDTSVHDHLVQHQGSTVEEIAEATGLDPHAATAALNRLRAEGKVERRFEEGSRLMLHRSVDPAVPLKLFEREARARKKNAGTT
jgi:DNA-binding transcriptional ArsR family regulator